MLIEFHEQLPSIFNLEIVTKTFRMVFIETSFSINQLSRSACEGWGRMQTSFYHTVNVHIELQAFFII